MKRKRSLAFIISVGLSAVIFAFSWIQIAKGGIVQAKRPSPTPTPSPTSSPSPSPRPPPLLGPGDIGTFSTTSQAQLPQTLHSQTTVSTNIGSSSYIYVLGGYTGVNYSSTVYKALFDGNTGDLGTFATTAQSQLPRAIGHHAASTATLGASTYVYVTGGYNGLSYFSTVYKASLNGITGDAGVFDTTSQSQLKTTLSGHTSNFATIGPSTYLYVLGGSNSSTTSSTVYKSIVDTTTGDIGTFNTTSQAQFPQVIKNHSSIIAKVGSSSYLYAVGGNNLSTVYKAILNNASGDVGTFATTSQAQLPTLLGQSTLIISPIGSSTYMYVIGGNNVNSKSTVYKTTLNGITGDVGTFATTDQSQLAISLSSESSISLAVGSSTYIYVLGGNNSISTTSTVYKTTIHN